MVAHHPAVGFFDHRIAPLRVVFPDDRVERDLAIFSYPEVTELACVELLLLVEELLDCGPDKERRGRLPRRSVCLQALVQRRR